MPKSTRKLRLKSNKVYLDYASGVQANASSIHQKGVNAKRELENARRKVADVLSARPAEVVFTSGGTESNNIAIQGVVFAALNSSGNSRNKLPHIITTNIEHASVLETFRLLESRKLAEVSIVPVESNGIIDPKKIKKEIKANTVLVSVMYANNEIGTIQPIREIAKEMRHFKKKGGKALLPLFHVDAVQAANYLDLNVERLGVDLLSLSGSKIEGAGRAGVLYKRTGIPLVSVFGGGDQEYGLRPGTENVPAVVSFSLALEHTQKIKEKESKRLTVLRDYLIKKLLQIKDVEINGDLERRLPNNINITIPKIPSDLLVIELSARGIYASAKSACKSGDGKASHVIEAINKNIEETDGSLRISLGRDTTKKDLDYTIKALVEILKKLKKWYD